MRPPSPCENPRPGIDRGSSGSYYERRGPPFMIVYNIGPSECIYIYTAPLKFYAYLDI
jgi:hypothetical protein